MGQPARKRVKYKAPLQMEQQRICLTPEEYAMKKRQYEASYSTGDGGELFALLSDLTIAQDRALDAIQILLDGTGHKGNTDPVELDDIKMNDILGIKHVPRLTFTTSEYLEAYGLAPNERKGKALQDAMRALFELSDIRLVLTYSYPDPKKKGRFKAFQSRGPLFQIDTESSDLTKEELMAVKQGQLKANKVKRITISLNPIFTVGIDDRFVLKDRDQARLLRSTFKGKVPHEVKRLLDYIVLLDHTNGVHQIGFEKLAYRLGLGGYIKARKKKYAQERIERALAVAKEHGYIRRYERGKDAHGQMKYIIHLDPDVSTRIQVKQKRTQKKSRKKR